MLGITGTADAPQLPMTMKTGRVCCPANQIIKSAPPPGNLAVKELGCKRGGIVPRLVRSGLVPFATGFTPDTRLQR
jgi:hypothetical protein